MFSKSHFVSHVISKGISNSAQNNILLINFKYWCFQNRTQKYLCAAKSHTNSKRVIGDLTSFTPGADPPPPAHHMQVLVPAHWKLQILGKHFSWVTWRGVLSAHSEYTAHMTEVLLAWLSLEQFKLKLCQTNFGSAKLAPLKVQSFCF